MPLQPVVRVCDLETVPSPLLEDCSRLSARVVYDDAARPSERVFYDVPHEAAANAPAGDVWATALLPLAMRIGEPLHVEAAVDPRLAETLGVWSGIFDAWFPRLSRVSIEPAELRASQPPPDRLRGSFFSGGIDSWYNVLCYPVDVIVCVWGFDIPLRRPDAFARAAEHTRGIAGGLGLRFVPVATNLRDTRWETVRYGAVGHGAALAGAAHALSGLVHRMLIASSSGYHDLSPWGSHPLSDPLLGSSTLEIVHAGLDRSRAAKTEVVARSEEALRGLRICYTLGSDENCGRCAKCLRTMITLELLGVLDLCPTLPDPPVDLARLGRVRHTDGYGRTAFGEIADLARASGRPDVQRAIQRSLERDARLKRRRALASRLRQLPLAWRVHDPFVRWLEGRMVS